MYSSAITRGWFSADAIAMWDDRATIKAWIEAEIALARAQGELGMIPADTHERMAAAVSVDKFDMDKMAADVSAILHPLVPFLRQFEAMCPDDVAGYLHWGITTQNIFDTGAALKLKRTHEKLVADLDHCVSVLASDARRYASTIQAGRTHGQHAVPVTFGYRLAGWALELRRQRERLVDASADALVGHFGGAAGTFGAMGGRGREVQQRASEILGLRPVRVPARSNFDGMANYMSALGVLAGLIEKMAVEIAFLQRTEIAEVHEKFEYGLVGSSTMAQKRNPARSNNIIGVCRLLKARIPILLDSLVRLNDADAATSNVADVTVPEVAVMGASLAEKLALVLSGLAVDEEKMLENFSLTNGMIMSEGIMMALAPAIGRGHAHHVLYDAVSQSLDHGQSFKTAILSHPALADRDGTLQLADLVEPQRYVREIVDWIEEQMVSLIE
ncbi:class-II fumarase/aspartase family protein [Arsenicitalea aurantiaca]|nr:adenylosuccinate lyase family protein [Arsenicitalea aurantiaca]